ncbi:hypothetical protein BRADI_2g08856v3 [Brachypodium distachyon]|uniref:C2H2-type domain-containing protein n=1 Tax=Brachypodium distachyon TaxID=15368 RepID=A0A0Q3FVZ8_BRADI|nr:hypothetical protein BRADI_2g08856v3 [Brachypodium distachyon]
MAWPSKFNASLSVVKMGWWKTKQRIAIYGFEVCGNAASPKLDDAEQEPEAASQGVLALRPMGSLTAEEAVDILVSVRQELQVADLSQTCRRERFCIDCSHAFCPHCCWTHHSPSSHLVIRVDADTDAASNGGRGCLVFPTHYSDGQRMYPRRYQDIIVSKDYATRLPRDAFCLRCRAAFSAASCPDHHRRRHGPDLPDAVLRIEERGGRHCVRCTGSEWWFPYVEMILDHPLEEDGDGEHQLLPVLTAKPGTACSAATSASSHTNTGTPPFSAPRTASADTKRSLPDGGSAGTPGGPRAGCLAKQHMIMTRQCDIRQSLPDGSEGSLDHEGGLAAPVGCDNLSIMDEKQ